jgi:hypothetical protein
MNCVAPGNAGEIRVLDFTASRKRRIVSETHGDSVCSVAAAMFCRLRVVFAKSWSKNGNISTIEQDSRKDSETLEQRQGRTQIINFPITTYGPEYNAFLMITDTTIISNYIKCSRIRVLDSSWRHDSQPYPSHMSALCHCYQYAKPYCR